MRKSAELRKIDHVGYVRFASVYRAFLDVADFREELDRLEHDVPGEGQLSLLGARADASSLRKKSAEPLPERTVMRSKTDKGK